MLHMELGHCIVVNKGMSDYFVMINYRQFCLTLFHNYINHYRFNTNDTCINCGNI